MGFAADCSTGRNDVQLAIYAVVLYPMGSHLDLFAGSGGAQNALSDIPMSENS
jgi:hypothetical protein